MTGLGPVGALEGACDGSLREELQCRAVCTQSMRSAAEKERDHLRGGICHRDGLGTAGLTHKRRAMEHRRSHNTKPGWQEDPASCSFLTTARSK